VVEGCVKLRTVRGIRTERSDRTTQIAEKIICLWVLHEIHEGESYRTAGLQDCRILILVGQPGGRWRTDPE
jgi:hypothetical protein